MLVKDLIAAVAEDFRQLRLSPLDFDFATDNALIGVGADVLAIVTRGAIRKTDDPARMVIEVARAVAPKTL